MVFPSDIWGTGSSPQRPQLKSSSPWLAPIVHVNPCALQTITVSCSRAFESADPQNPPWSTSWPNGDMNSVSCETERSEGQVARRSFVLYTGQPATNLAFSLVRKFRSTCYARQHLDLSRTKLTDDSGLCPYAHASLGLGIRSASRFMPAPYAHLCKEGVESQ